MKETGLLVLSSRSINIAKELLNSATKTVSRKLYVRLEHPGFEALIPQLYLYSASVCPNLDVRILLGSNIPAHEVLIGSEQPGNELFVPKPTYKEIVMGGTFDRLHNGHKVLLSKAIIMAEDKLHCGVTDIKMIQKKNLWELISPVEERQRDVEEFVADVSDGLLCSTFPISDPFGPSITIPTLDAIVVSAETLKGGEAVNRERKARSLNQLDVIVVDLLDDEDPILKETKISSSTRRREHLGTLLKAPNENVSFPNFPPNGPYLIGLTGGIASGKSNIAKYLSERPDFEVIDCDKVAHDVYAPGSELCRKIGETWPDTVENGTVDRRKLGAIVFQNQVERTRLNNLVWPAIFDVVSDVVSKTDKKYVVVEAAALVEAGWDKYLNEIWTVFVPRDEALERILRRDNLSKEHAEARLNSQTDNKTRVDSSHVVFCSLWAYEETRSQVDRAVRELRERTTQEA